MNDQEPKRLSTEAMVEHLRRQQAAFRFAEPVTVPVVDADADKFRHEQRVELWRVLIPRRYHNAHPADFAVLEPATIGERLLSWAEAPVGNLVLVGDLGAGKTHAAVAAASVQHFTGRSIEFWPIPELLAALRPDGPVGLWERLVSVDVLVLDDLGTERATDWSDEQVGSLINRRWLEELPIIATTNLDPGTRNEPGPLRAAIGDRAFSRLCGSGSTILRLRGNDRRLHNE